METIIPPRSKIEPSRKRFLFRAGMHGCSHVPEKIEERIRLIEALGLKLATPIIFSELILIEQDGIERSFLPRKLQSSMSVSIFAGSLGKAIDKEISDLNTQNKVLDATLLDAWASVSMETVNDWFDTLLRNRFREGTIRFSPGYSDMSITKNYEILERWLKNDLIKADKKTGILRPRKSTVCLIGWKNVIGVKK